MSSDFQRQCERERQMTLAMLSQRYTRQPSERKEKRLEMDVADRLETERPARVFEEFSSVWNQRTGARP